MKCLHRPKEMSYQGLKPGHAICEKCGAEIVEVSPRKHLFCTLCWLTVLLLCMEGVALSIRKGWIIGVCGFSITIITLFVFVVKNKKFLHEWENVDTYDFMPMNNLSFTCNYHKPDNPFISLSKYEPTSPDRPRTCIKCGASIQIKKEHQPRAKKAVVVLNVITYAALAAGLFSAFISGTIREMLKYLIIANGIFVVCQAVRCFCLGDICKWEKIIG